MKYWETRIRGHNMTGLDIVLSELGGAMEGVLII